MDAAMLLFESETVIGLNPNTNSDCYNLDSVQMC